MDNKRVSANKFIDIAVKAASRKIVEEYLNTTSAAISQRLKKYVDNGKIIKNSDGTYVTTDGKVLFHGEETFGVGETVKSSTSKEYHKRVDQEEIGGKGNDLIHIDTTPSECGARYMKDPNTLRRIDSLMSLMDDKDSQEIKTMFRNLAFEIFKTNLK